MWKELMYNNNVNISILKIPRYCENILGDGTISFIVTDKGFVCKCLSNCR
jgi:hypothetical protein